MVSDVRCADGLCGLCARLMACLDKWMKGRFLRILQAFEGKARSVRVPREGRGLAHPLSRQRKESHRVWFKNLECPFCTTE
jgi:hypothetical protein